MGIRLRFRVGNRRCIYDAITNHILELPKDLYDLVPQWERLRGYSKKTELRKSKNIESYAELREACREGLLSNELPLLKNPLEHCLLPEVFGTTCVRHDLLGNRKVQPPVYLLQLY